MIPCRQDQSSSPTSLRKTNNVTRPGRFTLAFGVLAAVAVSLSQMLAAVPVFAAGPEFSLAINHKPEIFHRGEVWERYTLQIANTGDAPTSGPFTVTDTLPFGLKIGPADVRSDSRYNTGGDNFTCTGDGSTVLVGTSVLVCTRSQPLAPGAEAALQVFVEVGADAPDSVTNQATVSGGGTSTVAAATNLTAIADNPFAATSFSARNTDAADDDYTVAGGHPLRNRTRFDLTLKDVPDNASNEPTLYPEAVEKLKDSEVALPTGFFGNPGAAPRCPVANIKFFSNCPPGSQIGFVRLISLEEEATYPLYNVPPDRGFPAQFIFFVVGSTVSLYATPGPRSESYGLTVGATDAARLASVVRPDITICSYGTEGFGGATSCVVPAGSAAPPFLTNPVDCSEADSTWRLTIDSWENPGRRLLTGVPDLSDPNWKTASAPASQVAGCDDPALAALFDPAIEVKPLQGSGPTQADQPAGLAVDLDFPQTNDSTDPNTTYNNTLPQAPEPKNITVKLPAGLSVSPSSADGLGACSDLASDPAGDQVHYDTVKPVTCPDASKIGSAVATSPLLATRSPETDAVTGAEPIPGDVYLLKPHPGDLAQGQDGKFRLLIQLENAERGINFKLPGIAIADKQTGQLTTVFTDAPQLPSKHLTVTLKDGKRAPLATPVTCGKFDTAANFVPWGTPDIPGADRSTSFNVGSGPNGNGCAATPGARPFAPTLSAGTESNKAGAASPFVMKLTRNDGEQELSSIDLTTPKGFTAKLAGVPYCSEATIAAAASKSGGAEQANSSCPTASQVGTITAGAGPGTNPYYVGGKAYLAGPYKGAPLSLAFITPAMAGPFDLGNVVVRAALQVNPETAQVTVKTDPLPQIIDGVPLRLRSIVARIDRPNFALNPTNCEPMAIAATVAGSSGASAHPTNSFQVGNCKDLGFKPDLKLSLKGGTHRSDHPALKATLTYPKGNYANIAKAVVSLPHSEFLAQNHIRTVCTRVQFAADQCPNGSIYGYVTATTPLLDQPLSGPLYLRSSSNPLPDLVAALHGQIDVDLVGRIDSKNGGIRTTFDSVPDAPVSKFVLTMQGGRKGLLENSRNLCNSVNRADVKFTAQNGRTANSKPVLSNGCKKAKGGRGKGDKAKGHKRLSWLPGTGF